MFIICILQRRLKRLFNVMCKLCKKRVYNMYVQEQNKKLLTFVEEVVLNIVDVKWLEVVSCHNIGIIHSSLFAYCTQQILETNIQILLATIRKCLASLALTIVSTL